MPKQHKVIIKNSDPLTYIIVATEKNIILTCLISTKLTRKLFKLYTQ